MISVEKEHKHAAIPLAYYSSCDEGNLELDSIVDDGWWLMDDLDSDAKNTSFQNTHPYHYWMGKKLGTRSFLLITLCRLHSSTTLSFKTRRPFPTPTHDVDIYYPIQELRNVQGIMIMEKYYVMVRSISLLPQLELLAQYNSSRNFSPLLKLNFVLWIDIDSSARRQIRQETMLKKKE
jgi:hypothetical protein